MTFVNARSTYRRAENATNLDAADPHEIIVVTLTELEKSLAVLAKAAETGAPYSPHHLNRAFTAIYILQSSLDFEKGGEVATNLFQVYEYCRLQVSEAFSRKPDPKLATCKDNISALLAAWRQIKPTEV